MIVLLLSISLWVNTLLLPALSLFPPSVYVMIQGIPSCRILLQSLLTPCVMARALSNPQHHNFKNSSCWLLCATLTAFSSFIFAPLILWTLSSVHFLFLSISAVFIYPLTHGAPHTMLYAFMTKMMRMCSLPLRSTWWIGSQDVVW